MSEREQILQERESTHGKFTDNARISQALKIIMLENRGKRSDAQNEALDMIALKLARILSGKHMEVDNWLDGAGYFKLGQEACESSSVAEEILTIVPSFGKNYQIFTSPGPSQTFCTGAQEEQILLQENGLGTCPASNVG